jgi:hypothetical protein
MVFLGDGLAYMQVLMLGVRMPLALWDVCPFVVF